MVCCRARCVLAYACYIAFSIVVSVLASIALGGALSPLLVKPAEPLPESVVSVTIEQGMDVSGIVVFAVVRHVYVAQRAVQTMVALTTTDRATADGAAREQLHLPALLPSPSSIFWGVWIPFTCILACVVFIGGWFVMRRCMPKKDDMHCCMGGKSY
jgi:hypothetical protein